jgi:hypothetical protein
MIPAGFPAPEKIQLNLLSINEIKIKGGGDRQQYSLQPLCAAVTAAGRWYYITQPFYLSFLSPLQLFPFVETSSHPLGRAPMSWQMSPVG